MSKPLIVIVGETASGKSELASSLAKQFGGEIINADSRTIYKGMDIGTAKPDNKARTEVRHHLIDIVEPGQKFTAADFKHLALQAIDDIRSRDKLPIMVGGTGLYVDSVIYDYQFRSKYDEKIRKALKDKSLAQLHQLAIDEGYTEEDLSSNRRHVMRLLEAGTAPTADRKELIGNLVLVGLRPSRAKLRQNIEARTELMFRRGLRREVEELAERYGWDSEAMSGIGYREFEDYFYGRASMAQVKRRIVQHTLQLAKRQRTWFKRNPAITWFDDDQEALKYVKQQL